MNLLNMNLKIFIKFDEAVDYKNLKFLGSNSFNTLDFLNQKMKDTKFLDKAKGVMESQSSSLTSSKLFSQYEKYSNMLKEYYLFPVTPAEISFKNIAKWEKIDTISGILKLKGKNQLQKLSFKSFIPEQSYNFSEHHLLDAFTTFILLKSLEMSDKPIRLILVGNLGKSTMTTLLNPVDLNFLATVESFDAEFDNMGSLNFSIEFEEFIDFTEISEEKPDDIKEKLFYKVE